MSNTNDKKTIEVKGNGLVSLLTVLFIGLKLTGHINWSWFWVLSPVIFTYGFVLMILSIVGLAFLVKEAIQ